MSARPTKGADRPGFLRRWFPAYFSDTPAPPTRVGLLNTGELVLIDPSGGTQVLGIGTVDTIRTALLKPPPN